MHGVSLSFLKELSIITNTSVLSVVLGAYYFYVHASNKFGSPRKAISTCEDIHNPAVTADAMFSKTGAPFRNYVRTWLCPWYHLI